MEAFDPGSLGWPLDSAPGTLQNPGQSREGEFFIKIVCAFVGSTEQKQ